MKKLTLTLVLILAAVYAALSALGQGGEYAAERLFYHAMRGASKISVNPDVAPPAMVASIENELLRVIEKYPKTNTAKAADIALAEFYLYNKRYNEALSKINGILSTYKKEIDLLSRAQFLKGAAYERQDQWNKALIEYTILRDKYPMTQLGLQIPLYIANYYVGKGREADANNAYSDAAAYYEKIESQNRGKMLGYAASTLMFQAYMNLKNHEKAGTIVEDIIRNYPSGMAFMQFLPYVEMIFVKTLNRPEKAIEIFEEVRKKVRDKELIKILQKKIDELRGQRK